MTQRKLVLMVKRERLRADIPSIYHFCPNTWILTRVHPITYISAPPKVRGIETRNITNFHLFIPSTALEC
ncbi:MAG: hypothetical protein B5M53_04015 [Candidatus Cloacimonas sp. 4484_209]|nr:MAG: hypothetical protein B5M53_04015 [Candidatus Cloacimonas sp. 4484_209]